MLLPSNGQPDHGLLPSGVYHYMVDVRDRIEATMTIGDDSESGDRREVMLSLYHQDAFAGANDVSHVVIWGDVDPRFHPRIATLEADSQPIAFESKIPLVLSAPWGWKNIAVRLFFRSGRNVVSTRAHHLNDGDPHVTILQQPFRRTLLSTDTVKLGWSCSHDLTKLEVCIAPEYNSPRADCALLPTGGNVNSTGTWAAGEYIESTFTYASALEAQADLANNGQAYVKVFATTAKGITS